jgi:hypothetical protein
MLSARDAVVEALATVPELQPFATMPDTPVAGAAWPVWAESHYRGGKLAHPVVHTYDVRVLLPSGYHPDTVDAADGLIEEVMAALSKCGTVETVGPVLVVFETNQSTMPGITARVTVSTC